MGSGQIKPATLHSLSALFSWTAERDETPQSCYEDRAGEKSAVDPLFPCLPADRRDQMRCASPGWSQQVETPSLRGVRYSVLRGEGRCMRSDVITRDHYPPSTSLPYPTLLYRQKVPCSNYEGGGEPRGTAENTVKVVVHGERLSFRCRPSSRLGGRSEISDQSVSDKLGTLMFVSANDQAHESWA
ncbi:hypothetical protein E2C01_031727 [Portunus trituberculatus]|uniref:Uncharacterized protein n=1 Tax=Portunus trituberculatus TaxID=210409 RepID=A0A5B7EZC8_PORTR|nr:hypothetical protein [Portunus trituberculatus]